MRAIRLTALLAALGTGVGCGSLVRDSQQGYWKRARVLEVHPASNAAGYDANMKCVEGRTVPTGATIVVVRYRAAKGNRYRAFLVADREVPRVGQVVFVNVSRCTVSVSAPADA